MKVKICGNQAAEHVRGALAADALGFVVASPRSQRNLLLAQAAALVRSVPPFVETVAVTAAQTEPEVWRIAREINPSAIQLQGWTDVAALRRLRGAIGQRLIVGVAVTGDDAVERARALAPHCDAILLDSAKEGRIGGTGTTHDWSLSRRIRDALHPFPVVLAGGLSPDNVGDAIAAVEPWAVDVASGVEAGGKRSDALVARFLEEARRAAR
ncbi:MAG TPA: phosphoribosylanthranilate isomerase [Candidatus Thermoplasmatota archaeon]|nr:phosphoribosylanthranilate isomerase [Candidatus Thermoplasmatota archaeon]